jgi:hypothetical protein
MLRLADAAMACLAGSLATALPLQAGTNETTWRASIEADIRNGARAEAICRSARIRAEVSDEVPFKNWAYGIARKYCAPDQMGQPLPPEPKPDVATPQKIGCRYATPEEISKARKGVRVDLSSADCVFIVNPNRQDDRRYRW